MRERLLSQEAYDSGFGYAESHFYVHKNTRESRDKIYLLHNPDAYSDDYQPKDRIKLVNFIKKSVYLSVDELDYDQINYSFEKIS